MTNNSNLRTAIIISEDASPGEMCNAAAIVMGQFGKNVEEMYRDEPVLDANRIAHAGIRYSVVILKTKGAHQLSNFANALHDEHNIHAVVFSKHGQSMNNAFDTYVEQLTAMDTATSTPIAVGVCGPEDDVRRVTKKFSVVR